MRDAAGDHEPWLGRIEAAYYGRAKDANVRLRGASGGVVTQLLESLLGKGLIDAALVTLWDDENPLRPTVKLARSPQDLLRSQKSKYCPVPLGAAFRELDEFNGRVAVVGLPCHMQGLENARSRRPEYCSNVALKVGLICDRILSFAVIDRLLERANVGADEAVEFQYRHKAWRGWPGDVYIRTREDQVFDLPRQERVRLKDVHTQVRCWVCPDKVNVCADLVCGDGYGPQESESREGVSLVLVRTEAGAEALEHARGNLEMREVEPSAALKHQGTDARMLLVRENANALVALKLGVSSPILEGLETRVARRGKALRRMRRAMAVESVDAPETAARLRERWQSKMHRRSFARRLARRIKGMLRSLLD